MERSRSGTYDRSTDHRGAAASSLIGYAEEQRVLLAARLGAAGVFFLLFGGVICALELAYFPERAGALLQVCLGYIAVCAGCVFVVRFVPRWTLAAALVAANTLPLFMAAYAAHVHNRVEMLALALVVFLAGLVVLFPWGGRGQALGSIGAVVGYTVVVAAGLTAASPVMYSLFALLTAVALTTWGAHLLEASRVAAYRRAGELQQSEEFSSALLRVARALSTTIRNPAALAEQLTERTREALGADWAVLYAPASDGVFRLAAVSSGAPPAVVEELRTVELRPDLAPAFFEALKRQGTVEVLPGSADNLIAAPLLARWQITAVLSQALTRNAQLSAILGCCYATRNDRFTSGERALLAAIANQAVVAIENARLMEEAHAANRVKSEFVATVSHELRTPLNVIIGYTDLLREDAFADPVEQRQTFERIRLQSTQLLDLIQAMLDVNRLEAGGFRLTIHEFEVAELFESLRANLPASWCREGVRLEWPRADGAIVMHNDRSKIDMILRNLIHNALKYTETGAVTVSAVSQPDAGSVCFSVSDTGPGIAETDLPAIFEMFRQGAAAPSRDGGVGLGLYIVKRLAEGLGGQVTVESRPGCGACFIVTLPSDARRRAQAIPGGEETILEL